MTWDFNRKTGRNGVIYTLVCSLFPSIDCWDKDKSEAFGKAMRDFIYYRSVKKQIHRYITLNAHICVVYEYGGLQGDEGVLHLEIDGEQRHSGKYPIKDSSSNGYFSFE